MQHEFCSEFAGQLNRLLAVGSRCVLTGDLVVD